ncbi:uncharacterized protein JCM6883_002636 [Sporobolomyces salmoneus]|uniref:uncharacterized protein n=1 Tax=Sporobolomyces salmoneus TaxID=183962 RepID=UPI00317041A4
MDRLPVELLRMIVEGPCLLSRVNRTLYTICRHRIYLNPILGNGRMVKKWIRNYSSLVNPWSICAGTQQLETVVVPESIRFKVYKSRIQKLEDKELPAFLNQINDYLPPLNDFAFSSFFFRNCTTVTVSDRFPLPDDFIVSLYGPLGTNRDILKKFSLKKDHAYWLTGFLFEACNRMLWSWMDMDGLAIYDLIAELRRCEPLCESLYKRKGEEEDDDYYISDDEYEQLTVDIAPKYAPSNYQVFYLLSPESYSSHENLSSILQTRDVPCHPFKALESLTIHVSSSWEVYLILHSRLFPVLRRLKLNGYFGNKLTIAHDVKLLRRSITRRKGKIIRPGIEEDMLEQHPTLFDSWKRLTKEEMKSEPKIDYIGPDLKKLDLSDCEIVLDE